MTEFEKVLQECLRDLEQGTVTMEECLSRHPKHSSELRPILLAGAYLERSHEVPVPDALKARLRTRVMQDIQAHPRRPMRSASPFMRLAIGCAAVALALLATGTAYAQGTLPGSAFYPWKLASEHAWRAVSFDPLQTDLAIAHRRADELIAVRANPVLRIRALEAYEQTAARLRREVDEANQARILPVLDSQIEELHKLGILFSRIDPAARPSEELVPAPTTTLVPLPATEIPQTNPTGVPQIPPAIIPTKIVPTIEIPPPIP